MHSVGLGWWLFALGYGSWEQPIAITMELEEGVVGWLVSWDLKGRPIIKLLIEKIKGHLYYQRTRNNQNF